MTAADGAESLGSKNLKPESTYAHKRAEHKDKAQSSQKFLSEHFRTLHDIEKIIYKPFWDNPRGIMFSFICRAAVADIRRPCGRRNRASR